VKSRRATRLIVLGEAHLRRIPKAYARYYNDARTHLSLRKDAPFPRSIERTGRLTSMRSSVACTISTAGHSFR